MYNSIMCILIYYCTCRSLASSSPASVVPVRDGRFLGLGLLYYLEHYLNSLVVAV